MPSQQHRPEHFPSPEQMVQIGPAVFGACGAVAGRVKWRWVIGKAGLAHIIDAGRRVGPGRSPGAGWNDAVKHVDASLDRCQNVVWRADTHEVPRLVDGQAGDGYVQRVQHRRLALSYRQATDSVSVKADIDQFLRRTQAQIRIRAALDDAEQAIPVARLEGFLA